VTKITRHNFFLPDELVKELKALAKHQKLTMAAVIRQALEAYIDEIRCKKTM